MDRQKVKRNLLWVALLLMGSIWIVTRNGRPAPYHEDRGVIFGTFYKVTYQGRTELEGDIKKQLNRFDGSLSPFNDTSVISRINRGERVKADSLFANVFKRSMQIAAETEGAFDITVAPLVNAWGFGFKKGIYPTQPQVDSLLALTGYEKVTMTDQGEVVKQDPRIMLTCSAVAKGYAVDVIGDLLRSRGIENFMVDIGGEVVVNGLSPAGKAWRIGINKPVDDSLSLNQELEAVLNLSRGAVATSGNYRNFYYKDGKKYAHTIDPRTGYPVLHSLLSATVIAPDCMSADAYATAFMVMGLEPAKAFASSHPDIEVFLIYTDEHGELHTYASEGMKAYIND